MSKLVTFEQAKKLKDLRYDVECRDFYVFDKNKSKKEDSLIYSHKFKNHNILDHLNTIVGYASAPTVPEALDWLRECKGIEYGVYPNLIPNTSDHQMEKQSLTIHLRAMNIYTLINTILYASI